MHPQIKSEFLKERNLLRDLCIEENNAEYILKEIVLEDLFWTHLTQDSDKRIVLLKTEFTFRVP
jgi:hypothetical protein